MTSQSKVAYICGPMSGKEEYNFPAFDEARDKLKAIGYTVISPADLDRACGFDPTVDRETKWSNEENHLCVKRDLDAILRSDWVVLLEGWETSVGATAEVAVAKWLRKPVHLLSDLLP